MLTNRLPSNLTALQLLSPGIFTNQLPSHLTCLPTSLTFTLTEQLFSYPTYPPNPFTWHTQETTGRSLKMPSDYSQLAYSATKCPLTLYALPFLSPRILTNLQPAHLSTCHSPVDHANLCGHVVY
jgi:hypothetical protein